MSKKIDELITNAGLAINNSLQSTELQPLLAEYGYTTEKLSEEKALLENAGRLNTLQVKEYGEQYQATDELEAKSEQAYQPYIRFYTNLAGNEEWLAKMATYGVTAEKLTAGQALVKEVEEALNKQKTEMGEAQEATRMRDRAADELKGWYSDFIAIARIALEDKPQYLEMLGIMKR